MARPVYFRIIESGIVKLNQPGMPVNRTMNELIRDAERFAKQRAPKRSGRLAKRIQKNYAKPTGPLTQQGGLGANIGYALYVHEGTTGPIKAKSARFMKVPKNRRATSRGATMGKGRYFLADTVRGQKSQPFLSQGIALAMARNPKIRASANPIHLS